MTTFAIAGRSHGGRKRPTNEDHILVDATAGLAIVADGMGGERGGETAARSACDAIAESVRAGAVDAPLLRTALEAAAVRVLAASGDVAPRDRMGTTVAAIRVIADNGVLEIAHVGDVRVYVLRRIASVPLTPATPVYCPPIAGANGVLVCLTRDHSPLCELVERGHVDAAAARKHHLRGKVSRALGRDQGSLVDAMAIQLVVGDRVLVCSDGVWDAIDGETIVEILEGAAGPDAACDQLVAACLAAGGPDNIGVAVLDWCESARRAEPGTSSPQRSPPAPQLAGVLGQLGRDLTAAAAAGKLDPVIGREREVRELGRVLTHRRKSNALLVGEPGVGKTAVVEALAQRLAEHGVADELAGLRVIEIPVNDLIAGTQYRGDLQARVRDLIDAAEDRSIVLFFDELHAAISIGDEASAGVFANALKPALARGKLRVIGATTRAEYARHFERDEAFARRFEVIEVAEPTPEQTLAILRELRPRLATHYRVTVDDDALAAAIELARRFLPDRRYPDKAIDLLDRASSRLQLRTLSRHERPSTPVVGRREIAEAVAERARVSLAVVLRDPRQLAADLEAQLRTRIKGQPDALARIAEVVRHRQAGIGNPQQPLSMLFVGPTGVGKTATARALAELVFGRANALVKLDMSEYVESHTVARLLGAPPGYVGHGEPGQLTGPVRRQPACVVLLDEIEKAHLDVLLVLLQVLQDGVLTDARGHTTAFHEAIVVMTSNLALAPQRPRVHGFQAGASVDPDDDEAAQRTALASHLPPELVGRIGSVVAFRALEPGDLSEIVDLVVTRIEERLRAQGATLPDAAAVRARVRERVEQLPFGVRQLERVAEHEVGRALDAKLVAAAPDRVLLDTTRTRGLAAMLVVTVETFASSPPPGDTAFTDLIARVLRACRTHASSADLQHLESIGVGVFCCYGSVDSAVDMARDIAAQIDGTELRRIVHFGRVRHGPEGERLGLEVARLFRIEAVRGEALPTAPLVVTHTARERLGEARRANLVPAGAFKLAGFPDATELWLHAT